MASKSEAGTVNITGVSLKANSYIDLAGRDPVSANKTFTQVGAFNDTAHATDAGDGFSVDARSHVDATIGQGGFSFNSRFSYDSLDTRSAGVNIILNSYDYRVDFTIDSAYEFDFISDITNGSGSWGDEQGDSRVTGTLADGNAVFINPNESGVLQPGTYTLRLQQSNQRTSNGDPSLVTAFHDYNFSLDLSPVDGGGSPNPIPLPPAVWSGLAVLGVGVLNRFRKSLVA